MGLRPSHNGVLAASQELTMKSAVLYHISTVGDKEDSDSYRIPAPNPTGEGPGCRNTVAGICRIWASSCSELDSIVTWAVKVRVIHERGT
jgi:hypothetical protein